MIIYSPIPPELIWHNAEQERFEVAEEVINGVPVQIMVTGDKQARIERVLSTDPRHFLDASYQPGRQVEYTTG